MLRVHLVRKPMVKPDNLTFQLIKCVARGDWVATNFQKFGQNAIAGNRGNRFWVKLNAMQFGRLM